MSLSDSRLNIVQFIIVLYDSCFPNMMPAKRHAQEDSSGALYHESVIFSVTACRLASQQKQYSINFNHRLSFERKLRKKVVVCCGRSHTAGLCLKTSDTGRL